MHLAQAGQKIIREKIFLAIEKMTSKKIKCRFKCRKKYTHAMYVMQIYTIYYMKNVAYLFDKEFNCLKCIINIIQMTKCDIC